MPSKLSDTKKNRGRVAIVFPWAHFDTVPSLCNAAVLLARDGYSVHVFTHVNREYKVPVFDGYDISLEVLNAGVTQRLANSVIERLRSYKGKLGPLWHILRWCYLGLVVPLTRRLQELKGAIRVWFQHRQKPYRCFIGVDPQGLVNADSLNRFIQVPLVYYSLELLLTQELLAPEDEALKCLEIKLSRQAAFVIIQDRERAKLLAEGNQIPMERFVFVPNAPLGPARHNPSRYWHRRFGLSPETRIVLHAGSLGRWTGIEDIVHSVRSWPESWVLVVHTRKDSDSSNDIEGLRELAVKERVFFSVKPVPRAAYSTLVDGADIGVAFYVPTAGSTYTQRNIQDIGLSSGKVASYLRAGLPVIVNETASVSHLLYREGCGIVVTDASGIAAAIKGIATDYVQYSKQACAFFRQHLDFAGRFGEVMSCLDGLEEKDSLHDRAH